MRGWPRKTTRTPQAARKRDQLRLSQARFGSEPRIHQAHAKQAEHDPRQDEDEPKDKAQQGSLPRPGCHPPRWRVHGRQHHTRERAEGAAARQRGNPAPVPRPVDQTKVGGRAGASMPAGPRRTTLARHGAQHGRRRWSPAPSDARAGRAPQQRQQGGQPGRAGWACAKGAVAGRRHHRRMVRAQRVDGAVAQRGADRVAQRAAAAAGGSGHRRNRCPRRSGAMIGRHVAADGRPSRLAARTRAEPAAARQAECRRAVSRCNSNNVCRASVSAESGRPSEAARHRRRRPGHAAPARGSCGRSHKSRRQRRSAWRSTAGGYRSGQPPCPNASSPPGPAGVVRPGPRRAGPASARPRHGCGTVRPAIHSGRHAPARIVHDAAIGRLHHRVTPPVSAARSASGDGEPSGPARA